MPDAPRELQRCPYCDVHISAERLMALCRRRALERLLVTGAFRTQTELSAELIALGFPDASQATISKDLKLLGAGLRDARWTLPIT